MYYVHELRIKNGYTIMDMIHFGMTREELEKKFNDETIIAMNKLGAGVIYKRDVPMLFELVEIR